jgi:hypothetical protein
MMSLSSDSDIFDSKALVTAPLHESFDTIITTVTVPVRKSVSFGAMAATHEVISRYDYSPEELEASFFDIEDMRRMKDTARSEAKLLDSSGLQEGPSARGIEHRTRQGMKQKRQNRMNAYAAVFFEIDSQFEEDYFDEEAVADAYFEYSESCAMHAHKLGVRDALDACAIYEETPGFSGW